MRFARALAYAVLVGLCLFVLSHTLGEIAIDRYVEKSDYLSRRTDERVSQLQDFVRAHDLATTDAGMLRVWCKQQPLILMEVFRDDRLVFNSSYLSVEDLADQGIEARYYDWYSYYTIEFADGVAEVFIYCDDEYRLRAVVAIVEGVVCFLVAFVIFLAEVRKVARYILVLHDEVQVMEAGVLELPVTVRGKDELGELAAGLDSMRRTFLEQRTAEELTYQANQSLVTSLSHDLRTPLTKLMLYTEIVRSGSCGDEDQLRTYLNRIDEIAAQISDLADNILRYSMASTERVEVECDTLSVQEVLRGGLDEMGDYLRQRGFEVEGPESWPDECVLAHRSFVKRVLDNVASNIERYADATHPVRMACVTEADEVRMSIRNVIDDAAKVEGHGIGQTNIATMMEAMGGHCQTNQNGNTFEVSLCFLKVDNLD